ncbi:Hypothetical protein R9X50_00010700 [Acrodontium crateriforme]|uniref:RING-type E3 ubiquitin transferase n=1 Tax=Acrodontium crateriforme TaxID=150365 RepID=A0AAQ3LWN0_9PEZI|nr:Hypothetical protein R9X50_00010700 [Acrodontium crateriforme]
MRLGFYAGASTAAAAACLLKAFHERPNFYSATVYLSQSNACLLIITNLLLVLACSFMYGLQRLLYGPLRPIETEQLSEKAWYAVLDTLLAMPSFREDVGGWLLTMFVLLLAGKVWGWIAEGRVDVLEQQPPANPRMFHIRLASSLIVSVAFDISMLVYCIDTVLNNPRPGMMVIFTFEFAILLICSTFTLIRYLLSLVETTIQSRQLIEAIEIRKEEIRRERIEARQNETTDGTSLPASPPDDSPIIVDENEVDVPGWEEKRRYLFAVEVLIDFLKLIIYIFFFAVSVTFNGLPMHIMRDVYMTFASFSKRVTDYVAYRKATSDMNTRYPDATTEEIREDSCIVCRETMVAWTQPEAPAPAPGAEGQPPAPPVAPVRRDEGLRAKKLPCGHILHLRCLKAWLERQQVCPTCRRPVVAPVTETQGQHGAAGANPAAPNQPAEQRRNRANRPRILNLGPVRIGFLHGQAAGRDQIQEIANHMGVNAAGGQNANQQGPNHLGLEVPYTNTASQNRAPESTQIQLMQIEQRLLQEAHNLGVEQQQLSILRIMEGELARLRASHIPNQQPVGTLTGAQRGLPVMTFGAPQIPELLTGSEMQQFGPGHASLPEGLVLPEGWTAMPLHHEGASRIPRARSQPAPPTATMSNGVQSHMSANPSGPSATADAPSALQSRSADTDSQQPPENDSAVPTDDNGSPLFVPTATPTTNGHTNTQQSDEAEPPSLDLTTSSFQQSTQNDSSESKAPWANDSNGWNFEPAEASSSSSATGAAQTPHTAESGHVDKGKGKAVEIEDAPDVES